MSTEVLSVLGVSALASSAAILLALALRKPMRNRFGAQAAYVLWCIVPLSAIVALLPAPIATAPAPAAGATSALVLLPLVTQAAAIEWHFDARPWLAALWIAGVVLAACAFAWQQRRYVRALGSLSPEHAGTQRAQSTAGCPALVGAWRPRIVVPADFDERFSPVERRLILVHERLHRARGDTLVNLFAAGLRCLFWFNPLFHMAASRFRFDQELACDALVIARFPEARRSYAGAMLKTQLAGDSWQEPGLPVGCYWQSSHPLKERISMLKQPLPGRARSALGLAIAATLAIGGSYAAWAAQPAQAVGSNRTDGASAPPAAAAPEVKNGFAKPAPGGGATYRSMKRIPYPAAQIARKVEGVVYVKAHIDADGMPATVTAERIEPASATELAEAAVAGVRQWRFNPALAAGKPTASDEIIPIVFSLRPDMAPKVSGGTLDAIRVSPPDEPGAASADHPPTEDVTFRQMHPPKYPPEAVRDHVSGELTFKVLVDEHGTPQSVDVEHSDPPEASRIFAEASIEAIMQWRFNPGLEHGKPKAGYVLVPIAFTLTNE